ncbi:hypothetical protein D3C76_957460 [compost metagenome]
MELVVRHQRRRHIDRGTLDLGRPTGHVAQEVDGQLHIHHLRHSCAFAVVQAFQLRQQLGIALHQVGQFPQQVLPLPGAGAGPGRIIERLAGGEDGPVDIFRRGARHHAQHFAGGRVVQGHGLAIGGLDPVALDEHARGALDEGRSGGKQVGKRHDETSSCSCGEVFRNGCASCGFSQLALDLTGSAADSRIAMTSTIVADCDCVRHQKHPCRSWLASEEALEITFHFQAAFAGKPAPTEGYACLRVKQLSRI